MYTKKMKLSHPGLEGVRIPVESYVAGWSQMFPRTNKLRVLESSIEKRFHTTHLPYNASLGGYKEGWQISLRLQNIADKSVTSITLWLFYVFPSPAAINMIWD